MKYFNLIFLMVCCTLSWSVFAQENDALSVKEKNKLLIRTWFEEGWNNRQYEQMIPELFAEDWSNGNPIRPDQFGGIEGMFFLVNSYLNAFPDLQFKITHMVADEKTVAVRFETGGTHEGEIFNIKPTGKKVFVSAMVFFEMDHGKVKVTWHEMDLMALLNQLTQDFAEK